MLCRAGARGLRSARVLFQQQQSCCAGINQGTRLYGSLNEYLFSFSSTGLYVDIYAPSTISFEFAASAVTVDVTTEFPFSDGVLITGEGRMLPLARRVGTSRRSLVALPLVFLCSHCITPRGVRPRPPHAGVGGSRSHRHRCQRCSCHTRHARLVRAYLAGLGVSRLAYCRRV